MSRLEPWHRYLKPQPPQNNKSSSLRNQELYFFLQLKIKLGVRFYEHCASNIRATVPTVPRALELEKDILDNARCHGWNRVTDT